MWANPKTLSNDRNLQTVFTTSPGLFELEPCKILRRKTPPQHRKQCRTTHIDAPSQRTRRTARGAWCSVPTPRPTATIGRRAAQDRPYNFTSDVWSLGVVLYEVQPSYVRGGIATRNKKLRSGLLYEVQPRTWGERPQEIGKRQCHAYSLVTIVPPMDF